LEELVAGLLRPRLFPFGKLSKAKSAAHHVIIWDDMLSSGMKYYHLELMLSSGMKHYQLELMFSSGTKCYHL
jgi:hypothetical protein